MTGAPLGDEQPLAEGHLSVMDLPCGVRLCANDLTATRDNERVGVVSRSLTLMLMLDGDPGRYRIGATDEVVIRPGSAALIAAGEETRLTSRFRRGERGRSLVLQVSPGDLKDAALEDALFRCLSGTAVVAMPAMERLLPLARDLFQAGEGDPIARLLAESCALELLARGLACRVDAVPTAVRPPHPRDTAGVRRVRDALMADPAGDHRLDDLARLAGMSVSGLKTKFALLTGQSVFGFLRDRRLDLARHGLEREGWSVKQAAYAAGYAHPTNFATAYRRRFGMLPSETRRH